MAEMEKDDIEVKLSRAKRRRRVSRVLFYIIVIVLFFFFSPQGIFGIPYTIEVLFFALSVAAITAMVYYSYQVKKFTKQLAESAEN
jgi:4-hydroxybenzoate polyprenyltransferase